MEERLISVLCLVVCLLAEMVGSVAVWTQTNLKLYCQSTIWERLFVQQSKNCFIDHSGFICLSIEIACML